MTDKDFLVCDVVAHIPGGQRIPCSQCRLSVYAAPSGVDLIATRGLEVLCMSCARPRMQAGVPIAKPTAAQGAEIAAWRRGLRRDRM